jgi:hypothetical protein
MKKKRKVFTKVENWRKIHGIKCKLSLKIINIIIIELCSLTVGCWHPQIIKIKWIGKPLSKLNTELKWNFYFIWILWKFNKILGNNDTWYYLHFTSTSLLSSKKLLKTFPFPSSMCFSFELKLRLFSLLLETFPQGMLFISLLTNLLLETLINSRFIQQNT